MTATIVLGMPEDEYHAVDALSSSRIKDFLRDPFEYWAKHEMGWARNTTDAQAAGNARHCMMLEGPEAFAARYASPLDPLDCPGALVSASDYKAACREHGLPVGGTKADLRGRLVSFDAEVEFFDDLAEQHMGERIQVSADLVAELERAREVLELCGAASLFTGGFPEASIFWTETHRKKEYPCKARVDYLKVIDGALCDIDLKTFSNPLGKTSAQIVAHALMYNRNGIQRAWYLRGLKAVRNGPVEVENRLDADRAAELEAALAEADAQPGLFPRSLMVFQEAGPIPTLIIREYKVIDEALGPTRYARRDHDDIQYVIEAIHQFREKGGTRPWGYDLRAGLKSYDDTDFPPFYLSDEEG